MLIQTAQLYPLLISCGHWGTKDEASCDEYVPDMLLCAVRVRDDTISAPCDHSEMILHFSHNIQPSPSSQSQKMRKTICKAAKCKSYLKLIKCY